MIEFEMASHRVREDICKNAGDKDLISKYLNN